MEGPPMATAPACAQKDIRGLIRTFGILQTTEMKVYCLIRCHSAPGAAVASTQLRNEAGPSLLQGQTGSGLKRPHLRSLCECRSACCNSMCVTPPTHTHTHAQGCLPRKMTACHYGHLTEPVTVAPASPFAGAQTESNHSPPDRYYISMNPL